MNAIGQNVKLLREKRGMTQDQLAFQLEITGWKVDRFLISKISGEL